LRTAWAKSDAIVCFLATGAAVRLLAPLLVDKHTDPGVVCVDEAGRHAVALLGGHAGGANALASRVADLLGAQPVITTATDSIGATPLDTFGADLGFHLDPPADDDGPTIAALTAALLEGAPVRLEADATWPLPALPQSSPPQPPTPSSVRPSPTSESSPVPPPSPARPSPMPQPSSPPTRLSGRSSVRLAISDRLEVEADLVYRPPSLVVGVGASRGVPADELDSLIRAVLAGAGLAEASVRALATVDLKATEPGILAVAERRGWPLLTYPAQALAAQPVPNPSEVVRAAVGTPSVAEAAALRAARDAGRGATLVATKQASAMATAAVARLVPRGRLTLVGLGPGADDLRAPRAVAALRRAGVVVGLDQYMDQIRPLLAPGIRVLASGLGDEEERARTAVALATEGHAVALIGSGDAGIYAMASPALQLAGADVDVEAVPGITAAVAAAALLGAPLGHDHAYLSLSDLHTPWPVIVDRLRACAAADLVVCLYNPRSARRIAQFDEAVAILRAHRPPDTPVGVVRDASRPAERTVLTSLGELDATTVDMRSVVIVGSTRTTLVAGRMVTPREYQWLR
jgi:cobalt-precorrin 5A hydrolase/precorrin-3B C17-methyltransferase